jgi:NADH pyrophosphatase NudC (nudix superfamily)
MIHNWELATGQQISVDNQGAQTVVTILQTSAGQQQRTSSSFNTGIWIVPPEMSITPTGATLKITTPTGASLIQVQGNSIQIQSSHSGEHSASTSTAASATFTSGSEPMQPMQPMQMGNMHMNMQPMVMRMGNMELNMGATASQQRFCSECGTPVKATDKFCASCGNKLDS